MTDTREKLSEARYFLERMVENQSERDAFKYNLSAFLAAFRSVTYVMKKEFKECDGFCEWYNNMIGKLTDDELKLLRDKRIRTIHYEPVRPNANINLSLTLHAPPVPECSVSLIVTNKEGEEVQHYASPPSEPTPVPSETEATVQYRWYFEGIPDSDVDSDVVTVCRYGLAEAETIVSECEQKFSQ